LGLNALQIVINFSFFFSIIYLKFYSLNGGLPIILKTLLKGIALGAILSVNMLYSADTLLVDKNIAEINWVGKKVTGEHDGSINIANGWIVIDKNTILNGLVTMDMTTITNEDIESPEWRNKLEAHLKNEDFFHVDSFPTSQLQFLKPQSFLLSDTTLNTLSAELTIRGITHPVQIPCIVTREQDRFRASGELKIDRTLFNVKYGSGKFFDDLGDRMIYDEFTIKFDLRLKNSIGISEE